ncbi:MAG: enhanced serine sensitivity protein SseB C-terminal domain-containing protein, partial [Pyrinomonadaceae bacterium]
MSNRAEELNIPAGARIRIGVPAEKPQEAIDALTTLFSEMPNVVSARLGLMEILSPDGTSEFNYT